MVKISVKELEKVVSGKLCGNRKEEELVVEGISIDTRKLSGVEAFVALKGEKSDGHIYISPNINAKIVIVQKPVDFPCYILVEDTYKALGDIARFHRRKYNPLVFAITGSNGKTTTKEILKAILEEDGKVLATEANFNNEIGLPLTLFKLDETYKYVVLEMGMRGLGQIDYLAKIAMPKIGIITVIGEVHLELLKTRENIAKTKGELLENLPQDGLGIIPRESDFYDYLKGLHINSFSFGKGGDIKARNVTFDSENRANFVLLKGKEETPVKLGLSGEHNVNNALAAAAAASFAGISLTKISHALENISQVSSRLEEVKVLDLIIIDDTYNASPLSMKTALQHLRKRADSLKVKAYAALGDMKELGEDSDEYHREIGRICADLNLDGLYLYGEQMQQAYKEAKLKGLEVEVFTSHKEIADELKTKRGIALLKGSRSMEMEKILKLLQQ